MLLPDVSGTKQKSTGRNKMSKKGTDACHGDGFYLCCWGTGEPLGNDLQFLEINVILLHPPTFDPYL